MPYPTKPDKMMTVKIDPISVWVEMCRTSLLEGLEIDFCSRFEISPSSIFSSQLADSCEYSRARNKRENMMLMFYAEKLRRGREGFRLQNTIPLQARSKIRNNTVSCESRRSPISCIVNIALMPIPHHFARRSVRQHVWVE